MTRIFIIVLLLLGHFSVAFAQREIPLYPGAVPNAKAVEDPEYTTQRETGGRAVFNTANPSLTVYQPTHPNGKAVIICPGGGYVKTAIDKEGVLVAQRLLADSITAFVLKYRIPQDLTNVDKSLAPLQDAQQAIRHVRQRADEYAIDAHYIGIMGFSAGGHLAASAATQFQQLADYNVTDSTSVRPDFAILIYPVISFTDEITHRGSREHLLGPAPADYEIQRWSNEKRVTPATPPTFLVHAADDRAVPVQNSLRFYEACVEQGVPVEMHLYPSGGHGFGMYNTTTPDDWTARLTNWLKTL